VLGDRHHASGPELPALEALDDRLGERRDQRGILAEGAANPVPARLGDQVGHRPEQALDADRPELFCRDLSELPHQLRIPRDGEPN